MVKTPSLAIPGVMLLAGLRRGFFMSPLNYGSAAVSMQDYHGGAAREPGVELCDYGERI